MNSPLILSLEIILLNLICLGIIFIIQEWKSRTSEIPLRSKRFLYLQDLLVILFGDFIGLSLIDSSMAFVIYKSGFPPHPWPIINALVSVVVLIIFHKQCTSQYHIPDMGYPKIGKISLIGIFHIPYFIIQLWIVSISVWYFINVRNPVLFITVAGLIFYCLMCFLDIKKGKYWKWSKIKLKIKDLKLI